MTEKINDLRESIFDLVTDPPCRKCEFWDVQGHYCWLKNMHADSLKCDLMSQILALTNADKKQAIERVFALIEQYKFAEPQHIPQSGKESVIICLTESELQELKSETIKEL